MFSVLKMLIVQIYFLKDIEKIFRYIERESGNCSQVLAAVVLVLNSELI